MFVRRCIPEGYCRCQAKRLPRKKKKLLKKYDRYIAKYDGMFGGVSWCTIKEDLKRAHMHSRLISYLKKNEAAINFILHVANLQEEATVSIDKGNFNFVWCWEGDNGLYTTNGTMNFIYKKSEFDDTWAGTETQGFLENLGIKFESISNDRQLIECVKKMSKETMASYYTTDDFDDELNF